MITLIPADTFNYVTDHISKLQDHWLLRYDSQENKLYMYAPQWSSEHSGCCVAIFDIGEHGLELRRTE